MEPGKGKGKGLEQAADGVLRIRETVGVDDEKLEGTMMGGIDSNRLEPGRESPFRMAWLFVEGWRERLRKHGDIVEECRWEWRLDDVCWRPNRIPYIVATEPAVVSVLRDRPGRPSGAQTGELRRKSVHWGLLDG